MTRLPRFPSTRYQGSKRRILGPLRQVFAGLAFDTALDLYSGTGSVSLLLRWMGKRVTANDYLRYNAATAGVLLTASAGMLRPAAAREELRQLLHDCDSAHRSHVRDHYAGIFFTDAENAQIDTFAQNVASLPEPERGLYIHAVGQALMKKRPFNLFHRANLHLRLRQVRRGFGNAVTWETSIADHAAKAIRELAMFPFDTLPPGRALNRNTLDLQGFPAGHDLVYLDPPYLNARAAATDYGDLYGFLDGLCCYELYAQGNPRHPHRPQYGGGAGWDSRNAALEDLRRIAAHWPDATLVMSWRGDGQPSPDDLAAVLRDSGRHVHSTSAGDCKYVLSRGAASQEIFLVAAPRT